MRVIRSGCRAFCLTAVVLCLFPGVGLGHRVNVFAYVEGDTVHVECGYSRSARVRSGEIEVTDPVTKAVYLSGKTDDKGNFSFPVPAAARAAKADLRILLRAGEGHQNDWTVKAEEYLAAAPAASSDAKAAPVPGEVRKPSFVAPPAPSATDPPAVATASGSAPAPAAVSPDPAALQAVVEAAVEKKIAPLRKMLLEDKEKGPGMPEIVGGLGYLVGLAGLAAWLKNRKGRPHA